MSKRHYSVMYIVHAATTVDVMAESVEESKEIADREVHASVCHHCSSIIDVGDIGDIIQVMDEDSGEVVWEPEEDEP